MEEAPRKEDVGLSKANKCPSRILDQTTVAHLAEAPQPFDHCEDMPHARPDARLGAVDHPGNHFARTALVHALVRCVTRVGRLGGDQRLRCARVSA